MVNLTWNECSTWLQVMSWGNAVVKSVQPCTGKAGDWLVPFECFSHLFSCPFALPHSFHMFSSAFSLSRQLLICSNIPPLSSESQALTDVVMLHSSSTVTRSCLCSFVQTVEYFVNQTVLAPAPSLVCLSGLFSVLSLYSLFHLIHCEGFAAFTLRYILAGEGGLKYRG